MNVKMFVNTTDGQLINADYIVRVYQEDDKVLAQLASDDTVELLTPSMSDARVLFGANTVRP